jgi:anthranilate synthase/aminodeoxychorismate synthase-like glutamine amidotransferase
MSPRVVLIDNYDSFTHNLYQLLGELGAEPRVFRNDAIDADGVAALAPSHVVLSPGPGSPERPRDLGVCAALIPRLGPSVPVLGVCLGHQAIVHLLGGRVGRAPAPRHGKVSAIRHEGSELFAGLPPVLEVMRYHSLVAAEVPPCLRVTARSLDDGLVMAVEHVTWPLRGVQFHPESVGTPDGRALLRNFLGLAPEAVLRRG